MNKTDKIMMDCYRELFANSTPVGDFDKMFEEATINKRGQKEIPFMDYEIEESIAEEIISKHSKKLYVYQRRPFRVSILFGCSPKFKYNDT